MDFTHAKGIIESVQYREGWKLSLDQDDNGLAVLSVSATVEDRTLRGTNTVIRMRCQPPVQMCDEGALLRYAWNLLRSLEDHERLEWFRNLSGEPVFPPHVDRVTKYYPEGEANL